MPDFKPERCYFLSRILQQHCICLPCVVWPFVWSIVIVRLHYLLAKEEDLAPIVKRVCCLSVSCEPCGAYRTRTCMTGACSWPALALACGLPLDKEGQPRILSPSQHCKRRHAAGASLHESLFVLVVLQALRRRTH
ncbi:MAG TPA: hypothetical protein VHV10_18775, partial [Ktedonobacteraceae bacterium]|nr:hypothetical protein [Ktedonobacteraceae bacterium]